MDYEDFDFNKFSDVLVRAWKYARSYPYKCCCPNCEKIAIKSHLIQQHPILASICNEKNTVFQIVDNDIDPRSGNWNLYNSREAGITIALQHKLFCKEHDNNLFKDLERRNSIPHSRRDCLLLAFRSACAVLHQEEYRLHIYESERRGEGPRSPLEENSVVFLRRMNGVIDNLWKAINGDGENEYCFRMIAMPRVDIVVSDCIIDEQDLEDHLLDDSYNAPLNCLFINLIPVNDKLYLLLGCDTRYDRSGEYKSIIMSFPIGDVAGDIFLGTLKGLLLKCSNWCCSPKLREDSSWKDFFEKYEERKVKIFCN